MENSQHHKNNFKRLGIPIQRIEPRLPLCCAAPILLTGIIIEVDLFHHAEAPEDVVVDGDQLALLQVDHRQRRRPQRIEDEPLQLPNRVTPEAEVRQVTEVGLLGLDGLVDAAQGQVVVVQDEVGQGAEFQGLDQFVASLVAWRI